MSSFVYRSLCLATALFAATLIGCNPGEDEKAPSDAAPGTAQPKSPEAQAQDIARQVTGQAQTRAQEVEQRANEAAADASANASATEAKAKELLDQAIQYINENKWDLAEKTLKQLDGMKASLPQSLQQQIDNANQLLQTRRTAGNVGGAVEGLLGK